jgi:hypothetical protein
MNGVIQMPVVDRETGLVRGSISAQELLTGGGELLSGNQSGTDPSWLRCKENHATRNSNGLHEVRQLTSDCSVAGCRICLFSALRATTIVEIRRLGGACL